MASHTHWSRLQLRPYPASADSPHAVYYLHFTDRTHYIGATSQTVASRLKRHGQLRGSWHVAKKLARGNEMSLAIVIRYASRAEAFRAEQRFKSNTYPLRSRCPLCHPGQEVPLCYVSPETPSRPGRTPGARSTATP